MSCAVIKLLIIFNWPTVPECQPPLPVIHVVLHLKKRGAESCEGHVRLGFLDEWHDHCACSCISYNSINNMT